MPQRPDVSRRRPDPRFDRYRQRVGRLLRGDAEVGLLLVEVEPWYEQVGGHLWWTRWGPVHEVLWEHVVVDGDVSDVPVPQDASEDVLRSYDAGRYDHYGEALLVVWTDQEESARLRGSAFDKQPPMVARRVRWRSPSGTRKALVRTLHRERAAS